MTTPVRARYAGYRFPAEIIGHAVWLYFRFPLGLRMVEELLAARGIIVSHETVRQWARKLASISPTTSVAACRGLATNGIWMRSCLRSPV
jgi:transposase-like protein